MIVIRYLIRTGLLLGLLLSAMTAGMANIQINVNLGTQAHTGGHIRNLVAPIALYPDPLLAILLPASTYPDQVIDADSMHLRGRDRAIDRQNWDISVKALAHYPNLLHKMGGNPNWTASLGQAYVEYPQNVMDAIQALREQASANGVLRSTREQRVYREGHYVRIIPVQADMIYVPSYDPTVVYVAHRPKNSHILLAFGIGLLIGSWLSNDTDWAHHRIYNHGWHGDGWIAHSRPHVTIINSYIINRNHPAIVNHNISHWQENRKKDNISHHPGIISPKPNTSSDQQQRVRMSPRSVTHPDAKHSAHNAWHVQQGQSKASIRPTVAAHTPSHKQPTAENRPRQEKVRQSMPNNGMPNPKTHGNMMGDHENRPAVKHENHDQPNDKRSADKHENHDQPNEKRSADKHENHDQPNDK